MKPPYRVEIDALDHTYRAAVGADIQVLRSAVSEMGRGPALLIGSGGSMALAELAAHLHEGVCRQPARACTSLQALDTPQIGRRGAVLFSSSAKHPDAQRVLLDFRRRRFAPAVLVTHRDGDGVQELAGFDTLVVTLPQLAQPDGFLATGSILQTATLLLRAYLPDAQLSTALRSASEEPSLRDEVLVLAPPSLACVAADLEVRLVESGLAPVQVSDYRNFAHGRHTGFDRRSERVTVIALSDLSSDPLATGTVGALPTSCDVRRWHVDGPWERAVVELLHRSIRLVGAMGERAGLDVARPKVPAFGRRLYRLPLSRRVPDHPVAGVERKLLAASCGEDDEMRRRYVDAGAEWSEELGRRRFAGLVLDYDGTVCWTQRRFGLPERGVQDRLRWLLDGGAVLGFASGRGRSLHADLRQWVPRAQWDRVVVGLYNGGVVLTLADDLPDLREPSDWSRRVAATLAASPYGERLSVVERGAQVSVEATGVVHDDQLGALLADRLHSAGVEGSIAASGHSVDIVPPTSTKLTVAADVERRTGGGALAIGDQGQLGGNDHALLARGAATLSVDRCSPDLVSCWFAGSGDRVGPAALERHLGSMRRRRDGFALTRMEIR